MENWLAEMLAIKLIGDSTDKLAVRSTIQEWMQTTIDSFNVNWKRYISQWLAEYATREIVRTDIFKKWSAEMDVAPPNRWKASKKTVSRSK
jgi:hypothetical protein